MTTLQLRPTFELESELSQSCLMRCLGRTFGPGGAAADRFLGQFKGNHGLVSPTPKQRHVWSPWMHLEVLCEEGQAARVHGRFSPNPSIWTAIMFSYLGLATICFFAAMFGIAQQLTQQTPWAYAALPAGLVIAIVLWIISQAGQRLAREDMQEMLNLVECCVAAAEKAWQSQQQQQQPAELAMGD